MEGTKFDSGTSYLRDLGQLGTTLRFSFLNIQQISTQLQNSQGTKEYDVETTSEGMRINKGFQTRDAHVRSVAIIVITTTTVLPLMEYLLC